MARIKSEMAHQDVLSLCSIGGTCLAAVGSYLYVYRGRELLSKFNVFNGQKIHKIKESIDTNVVFVTGGKYWTRCSLSSEPTVKAELPIECSDWILDILQINKDEIVVLTAHNQAQLWNICSKQLITCSSPKERCILYSGTIWNHNKEIYILAGTVYSEVIVWKLSFESRCNSPSVLFNLTGHKGVIFSIDVGLSSTNQIAVCTTSDDRSARLYFKDGSDFEQQFVDGSQLLGHTGRVWKSLVFSDCIFTIGEDSLLCNWDWDGRLLFKAEMHQGGGIRSLTAHGTQEFLTGGSDGAITIIPADFLTRKNKVSLVDSSFGGEIPRKVKFLGLNGIVVVTDNKLFYSLNFGENLMMAENNPEVMFTDLAVSPCGDFAAVTTVCGLIKIFKIFAGKESQTFNVGDGHRCAFLRWKDNFLLIQNEDGLIKLFRFTSDPDISLLAVHLLPPSKQREFTCFQRLHGQRTIVGDRMGNLHLFRDSQATPIHSLIRFHSLFDISLENNAQTVITVGAGGWIKKVDVSDTNLSYRTSFAIPLESTVRIIATSQGTVFAGFRGSFLKLWHLETGMELAEYNCGGSHRSFDFSFETDNINFVFVKDKKIYHAQFQLRFCKTIRSSYHSKTINCLEIIQSAKGALLVSGGDDNALRLVYLRENDIELCHIIDTHISSIRALAVHPTSNETLLIISVGGREQLLITEYNQKTENCREILNHLPSSSVAESRFMCLQTLPFQDGVLIFVGCSDCSIRIFFYKSEIEALANLQYTNCLLNLKIVRNFLVSFSTDGKVCFWDLTQFLTEKGSLPNCPVSQFTLHQSGINSVSITEEIEDKFLFFTGGDDNLLSIAVMSLTEDQSNPWQLNSQWSTSTAHSCQITGLQMIGYDTLLSTSVDQRVVLHKIRRIEGKAWAEMVQEMIVAVPDAHGISVKPTSVNTYKAVIYGKGIEVLSVLNSPERSVTIK